MFANYNTDKINISSVTNIVASHFAFIDLELLKFANITTPIWTNDQDNIEDKPTHNTSNKDF